MPIRLYACLNASCRVFYFRNRDGTCARCGEPGKRIIWSVKPR